MRHATRLLSTFVATATMLLVPAVAGATSIAINFDQFNSPPVTCCYSNTGVTGPVIYPEVTVTGLGTLTGVMNFQGWANMQTSGANLYGSTLGGARANGIDLTFTSGVSNLFFDVIDGTNPATFTVTFFDSAKNIVFSTSAALSGFTSPGSVHRFGSNVGNIWSAEIRGNDNFAIDTVNFDTNAVPEPASLVLLGTGLAFAVARLRRRRS